MATQTVDKGIKLSALFGAEHVACWLSAQSREDILRRLVDLLAATGDIPDVEEAYQRVLAREKLGCTTLAPGIAVPHARIEGLKRLHIALGTSREGIEFCGHGSAPVKLVVLILTPADDPGGYLQAQAALARACNQEPDLAEKLSGLEAPREVWKVFDSNGNTLTDYASAADMMNRDFPRLHTSDPLRKGIDEFCRLGIGELPVIDDDDDLVGVFSEEELLRVCLPDYILWMEDLSPILHFEPFMEVLKAEADTPVAEIMLLGGNYATVSADAPAAQVAKVMLKREVRQVLVVRGRKLLGVVTMQDFINKIMRA